MIVPAGMTVNVGVREYRQGDEIPDDLAKAVNLDSLAKNAPPLVAADADLSVQAAESGAKGKAKS